MNPYPVGVMEGMVVHDVDGRRVGKVIRCEAMRFIVERGLIFARDYQVSYDDIVEARDGGLVIRRRRDELLRWIPGAGTREGILEATEGEAGDSIYAGSPPPRTTTTDVVETPRPPRP